MCVQIRNILKQGIETPEDQNDLRKMQLRELARLNGTLREDDNRSVLLLQPHTQVLEFISKERMII